jgi:hypothetical protein
VSAEEYIDNHDGGRRENWEFTVIPSRDPA